MRNLRNCHYIKASERGFSLLEVMVATSIFALLLAVTIQMISMTSQSASNILTSANVQVKGERTLKLIVEAVTSSTNLGVDTDGDRITFFTPVDLDSDKTMLSKTSGELEYGVETSFATGVGEMFFKFVKERTIDESEEQVDLNSDGDMSDKFDMGYIVRSTKLDGQVESEEQVVGVNNVIQRINNDESPNYGASILNDADPDTDRTGEIFSVNASKPNRLNINLWLLAVSNDRRAHLIQCRSQVFLRNQ